VAAGPGPARCRFEIGHGRLPEGSHRAAWEGTPPSRPGRQAEEAGERARPLPWLVGKRSESIASDMAHKNRESIDGLPGLRGRRGGRGWAIGDLKPVSPAA